MKTNKILIAFLALGFLAFTDPYKHVKNVEGLGNFHQRVSYYKPFKPGEKLNFKIHYGWINAGSASMEVKPYHQRINNKEVYHLVGKGQSEGTFDWFFKVRDSYESFVDAQTINPYKFIRRVNEGGYIINRDYIFYQDENLIDDGKHKQKIKVPVNVQDIFSAFYYARTIDFKNIKVGDAIQLYSYLDYEVWPLKVRYKGIETVKIGAGTFECMRFVPIIQQGRVFKDEDDMSVYISNDKNKIPVLAKADILIGSVKMELTDWEGLAHPLAKVN